MSHRKDDLYHHALGEVRGFKFDQRVVDVFPDMISRSVPGYESVLSMTGLFAERYGQPHSRCYDLGCSLGASTLSMAARLPKSCDIVAVDNSAAMLAKFQTILDSGSVPAPNNIELVEQDICDLTLSETSFVAMNYTLQFVAPEKRDALLTNIAAALVPGGALLVSEKIVVEDDEINNALVSAHTAFKRNQGYSDLEIAQKRQAIENVLIPETLDTHHARFQRAGFRKSAVWFQCLNFCSMIAIK